MDELKEAILLFSDYLSEDSQEAEIYLESLTENPITDTSVIRFLFQQHPHFIRCAESLNVIARTVRYGDIQDIYQLEEDFDFQFSDRLLYNKHTDIKVVLPALVKRETFVDFVKLAKSKMLTEDLYETFLQCFPLELNVLSSNPYITPDYVRNTIVSKPETIYDFDWVKLSQQGITQSVVTLLVKPEILGTQTKKDKYHLDDTKEKPLKWWFNETALSRCAYDSLLRSEDILKLRPEIYRSEAYTLEELRDIHRVCPQHSDEEYAVNLLYNPRLTVEALKEICCHLPWETDRSIALAHIGTYDYLYNKGKCNEDDNLVKAKRAKLSE